jgi:hypothetical protein
MICLANSSTKLSFWIFADETNIIYSSSSIDEIKNVMNEEVDNFISKST